MSVSVTTLKQSITTGVTFRVRRATRTSRHRFTVALVGGSCPEIIGGAENLRDAVDVALSHMGPGDTLDARATI